MTLTLRSNKSVKELTRKHLKIVEKFVDILEKPSEGVLLTGSTAWGAYYAVNHNSDIDLLVSTKEPHKLEQVITSLIDSRLINPQEQERLRIFKQLHSQGEADQFSLNTTNSDVPVSIDFMFKDTLKDIASLNHMKSQNYKGVKIRVIDEFRANIPRPAGYSLDDLRGQQNFIYYPNFKEIKNDSGVVVGYNSQTLIDGQKSQGNQTSYFLGVMSFFLSINPIVLVDKNRQLITQIRTMQSNIAKIMDGQVPAYITRQERMTEDCLNKIKKSLLQP